MLILNHDGPFRLLVLAVCVVLPLGLLRNVDSLGFVCTASILFYLCLVIKVEKYQSKVLDVVFHQIKSLGFERGNAAPFGS
jgi:hypothetical protein